LDLLLSLLLANSSFQKIFKLSDRFWRWGFEQQGWEGCLQVQLGLTHFVDQYELLEALPDFYVIIFHAKFLFQTICCSYCCLKILQSNTSISDLTSLQILESAEIVRSSWGLT
jgi:hypothetical protein